MRPRELDRARYADLPRVARDAIRARLTDGADTPDTPIDAAVGAPGESAPVFVTLRIDGALRGCIGSLAPLHDDLVAETADRALAAAFEDSRFPPLEAAELDRLAIEVTVLGELEPVASTDELDPHRFGIEVADATGRRGVLLPGVVESAAQQVATARRKAGIPPDATIVLRRFPVVKIADDGHGRS